MTSGLLDTGAEVSIAPTKIAKFFQLFIVDLELPVIIKFGNNSSSQSTQTAYFGDLIGYVFLMEEAIECLISVATMLELCDCEVILNRDGVTITDTNGQQIRGARDRDNNMWTLRLEDVINYRIGGPAVDEQQYFATDQRGTQEDDSGGGSFITTASVNRATRPRSAKEDDEDERQQDDGGQD